MIDNVEVLKHGDNPFDLLAGTYTIGGHLSTLGKDKWSEEHLFQGVFKNL